MQTGININLLRLLSNFLQDRKAYIRTNNIRGETFNLEAGVPQGDVLSPTLFLVMCNDYPEPAKTRMKRNFCMQYADDFTQVIINKFKGPINDNRRELHRINIQNEINRQNNYERKWKIKTNINKFQIIAIGFRKTPTIHSNGTNIQYSETGKLLGMQFTTYNFFTKQMNYNINNAKATLRRLKRFRTLKKSLKLRLYKTLVLPLLLYPIIPINVSSKTQQKRLQTVQNEAVRWICNEKWPIKCPIDRRHGEMKLEYMRDRIRRMAEGIWSKLEEENDEFFQETIEINMREPHGSYPSSYKKTFEP